MPLLTAAASSSGLVRDTACGPSLTTVCQKSQSIGVAASVADVDTPETVPGARLGLIVLVASAFGEDGVITDVETAFSSPSTLVGEAIPRPRLAERPINPAIAPPSGFSGSSSDLMPASSRILNALNFSRKVCLPGSPRSSNAFSVSSGLLPSVDIDVAVFLLASMAPVAGRDGDRGSLAAEVVLENQPNGVATFRAVVVDGGWGEGSRPLVDSLRGGGAPHGTEGNEAEKP